MKLKSCFCLISIIFFFISVSKADIKRSTLTEGFDSTGFIILAVGAASTFFFQKYDEDIHKRWGNGQIFSNGISRVGDFLGTGVPGGLLALIQLKTSPKVGKAHVEALLITSFNTYFLKYATSKYRPLKQNRLSMPSGHTSTMFASASVLAHSYGYKVGIPMYLLATLTGLSRINDDKHWLSDVIAGATIGIFWGRSAVLRHLRPVFSTQFKGLQWNYSF